jgi:dTMP kinase
MAFIVFEGLDGSGKSSLMGKLQDELLKRKISFIKTREPGGTALGDEIRQLILRTEGQAPTPRTELLLYEASRSQHVDCVIVPALKGNQWVLCDRYTASSLAFQAGGREISEDWVHRLNDFATNQVYPDLTVLLDLSVEESRKRRFQRSQDQDRMESEADTFHQKVRNAFLKLADRNSDQWLVLDASKSIDTLTVELLSVLIEKKWLN